MEFTNAYIALMKLDIIKIFIATYQTRSFAAVAKELNVSPSSISRSVATLENDLGVRLFQRTTRQLTPTEVGQSYYRRVLPLIEEMERLNQDLLLESSILSGKIRVTASTSYGQIVLAPLLKLFQQQYENITIELILSDSRLDLITERIDLAIRHGALSDSNLIARKLTEVKHLLVATPEYLNSTSTILTPEDLKQKQLVSFPYKQFSRRWCFQKGAEVKHVEIQPKLIISNASAMKECIKNNLGIAILADWTVENEVDSGELVQILTDWSISVTNENKAIWLVQPSREFIPEKVQVFKKFLLAHC